MKTLRSSFFTNHHILNTKNQLMTKSLISSRSVKPAATRWAPAAASMSPRSKKQKVVVIMGPTGCGKTKLSIDLASTAFPSSEVINSDKIQCYRGLDITTNKVPVADRHGVTHHLLGEFDPSESHPEFTPSDFRQSASALISDISARGGLPVVAGGSNSFVYALLAAEYDPRSDAFAAGSAAFCRELAFDCCFLWVDVAFPELHDYIDKRVDDMLAAGMFEELADYFQSLGPGRLDERGLNRAIGVPEFERHFRGAASYEVASREVKDNSWELVKNQVAKTRRLREEAGWEMNRVDTTASLRGKVAGIGRREAVEIWEREVLQPSIKIVSRFLTE